MCVVPSSSSSSCIPKGGNQVISVCVCVCFLSVHFWYRTTALAIFQSSLWWEGGHGKVNSGHSRATIGQTACVWGSEGISAGLVITAPPLWPSVQPCPCPCQFVSADRRLRVTQDAKRKVASFLQREQGERANERGMLRLCNACVFMCVLSHDSLYVCALGYFWVRINSTPTSSSFSNLTLALCHCGDLLPQQDCYPPFSSDPSHPLHCTLLHKCPPPTSLNFWFGGETSLSPLLSLISPAPALARTIRPSPPEHWRSVGSKCSLRRLWEFR